MKIETKNATLENILPLYVAENAEVANMGRISSEIIKKSSSCDFTIFSSLFNNKIMKLTKCTKSNMTSGNILPECELTLNLNLVSTITCKELLRKVYQVYYVRKYMGMHLHFCCRSVILSYSEISNPFGTVKKMVL